MGTILQLIEAIGTPFEPGVTQALSVGDCRSLCQPAFENRVGLLFAERQHQVGWPEDLKEFHTRLADRSAATAEVVGRLGEVLNELAPNEYVIFKSVKPYPATPNDTDVLFLGGRERYEEVYDELLHRGYIFHEWAPTQRTIVDPYGKDSIGPGKLGGTYYVDFYEDIATDYFAYLNKNTLTPYLVKRDVAGTECVMLAPEPELAILLFHNAFPERTFQLEHFYLPLFYLSQPGFDSDEFVRFVHANRMVTAVGTNLAFGTRIHQDVFGFVPQELRELGEAIPGREREITRFIRRGASVPYMFSPLLFWRVFLGRLGDPYSRRSLGTQLWAMRSPSFTLDVTRALWNRFSSRGTYHQE